mmetsp:Transcript_26497/g.57817  ORF Transcript_26497/g.57817 Transcript_26497/m.57817 type:complete len:83 (-) Transcript_26497:102-350(-)
MPPRQSLPQYHTYTPVHSSRNNEPRPSRTDDSKAKKISWVSRRPLFVFVTSYKKKLPVDNKPAVIKTVASNGYKAGEIGELT